MHILILAVIKVLDNIFSTARTIAIYKNKKLLTSFLVFISQLIFYTVTKSVISENSINTTLIICLSAAIGTYLAMMINNKFAKDATYTNILTCKYEENITDLCDYLTINKIKHIPFDSYNKHNEKTKTVLAFAATVYESKLIDQFVENSDAKYLRQVLH